MTRQTGYGFVLNLARSYDDGHIDPHKCIEWPYSCTTDGWPRVWVGDKNIRASRLLLAWKLGFSFETALGASVVVVRAGNCTSKTCVNQHHMRAGSPRDIARGEIAAHGKHPRASFNAIEVSEIRRRSAAGETDTTLADEYGVSRYTVNEVVLGRNYRHIGDGTDLRTPRRRVHLTAADIALIRARLASGEAHGSIALSYGVHRTTITDIATGRSWSSSRSV